MIVLPNNGLRHVHRLFGEVNTLTHFFTRPKYLKIPPLSQDVPCILYLNEADKVDLLRHQVHLESKVDIAHIH